MLEKFKVRELLRFKRPYFPSIIVSLLFHLCLITLLFLLTPSATRPVKSEVIALTMKRIKATGARDPAKTVGRNFNAPSQNSKSEDQPSPPSSLSASDSESNAIIDNDGSIASTGEMPGIVGRAASFSEELRFAIEQKKVYPAIAKSRGVTGRVEVGFTLKKDGVITNVHIVKPCPSRWLNDAAQQTIVGLGHFKPVPDEIAKADWEVVVPIEFRFEK